MSGIINAYKDIYISERNRFSKLAYIPLASNVYGITAIAASVFIGLIGVYTAITGTKVMDWKNTSGRNNGLILLQISVGFFTRGCVAQVPVIGNFALATFDILRNKYMAYQYLKYARAAQLTSATPL